MNFEDGCPKGRFGLVGFGPPNGSVWVLLGLQDQSKVASGILSKPPSRREYETLVDGLKIADTKTTLLLWSADVSPGPKTKAFGGGFLLNAIPPEISNDGS